MRINKEILARQINLNQQKNLLYTNLEEIFFVDSSFIKRIEEIKVQFHAKELKNEIDDLIEYVAEEVIKEICRINQYIDITGKDKDELKMLYKNSFRVLRKSKDIKEDLLKYHYPKLSEWLSKIYPEALRENLRNAKLINNIVCEEYSAEFQMELLRIDYTELKEPIIDVGCGKSALLANYLRGKGKDTVGIDRFIDQENEYLLKTDWNDYDFTSRKWGTIISNMAFSNHLIYSSSYDRNKFEKSVKKYNEMISSLSSGGEFIYAPGNIYPEKFLSPQEYEIHNFKITGDFILTKIKRITKE